MDYVNSLEYIERIDRYNRSKQWQQTKDIVLRHVWPGDRVMDYGSGTGTLLHSIAKCEGSARLYGVDSSWLLKAEARKRVPQAMFVDPDKMDVLEKMDLITCIAVIGHVLTPVTTLTKLYLKLNPDGYLILLIPSLAYQRLMRPISWLRGYKDDPSLYTMWSVDAMHRLLNHCGFHVERIFPVGHRFMGTPEANVFVCTKG